MKPKLSSEVQYVQTSRTVKVPIQTMETVTVNRPTVVMEDRIVQKPKVTMESTVVDKQVVVKVRPRLVGKSTLAGSRFGFERGRLQGRSRHATGNYPHQNLP